MAASSHRLRNAILGILVALLLAEFGTRAIASDLPPPLKWQNYEAQRKVQQMDALTKTGGVPVVFLGSSLVDIDIDPATVDSELGGDARSYNAGLLAATPEITTPWAIRTVIPRLHPKLIVVGLCSYDLGGEDPNRQGYINQFLDSAAERQLTGRTRNLIKVSNWIGDVSSLWRHKVELRDPETVFRALEGHKQYGDARAADLDANGRQTIYQYKPFNDALDLDVADWHLGDAEIAATNELIAYAHDHGIKVLLVDMPVTSQFVAHHGHGQADYDTYLAKLRSIGSATSSPVLYYDASMRDDSEYLDDLHLDHTGAEQFSTTLGQAMRRFYPGTTSGSATG